MVHETKQASATENQKHGHGHGKEDEISIADDEIEEIQLTQDKTFYDRITRVMEKFASNRLGQFVVEKTDRVLKVVEDTAKWSLPQDDCDMKLERPLPWIFFLTLIVWLRVFRIWFSVASYIVGAQPITPHTMVYYLQTKRRRLRAIRVQGLKSMRNREIEATVMCSSNKNVSFIGKLRKLFGSAVCKPGQHREVPARRVYTQEISNNTTERSFKRPRDDEAVDYNLTVDEMLDKYANEDSDNDSDYVPKEDEEDDSSTSLASSSSAEETDKDKLEKSNDNPKESKESAKPTTDSKPAEEKKEEMKENGGTKHRPKPLENAKTESPSVADSDKEEMHTPSETARTNGSNEDRKEEQKTSDETPATTTEVAPSSALNTPKSTHLLAPSKREEQKQKSTPGHESAASLKPSVEAMAKTAADKSYRTITTQTAIELDWTITIKTEITHTKHYPKLENINCSVNLTPASSTEDIFYSPIGSPQDFHHIFQPAPLVKGAASEAQTSTPKEADHHESSSSETPETMASNNQKKHLNQSNPHQKQNHLHHHHHAKNRNKNRR